MMTRTIVVLSVSGAKVASARLQCLELPLAGLYLDNVG